MTPEITIPGPLVTLVRRALAVRELGLLEGAAIRFMEDGSPGEVIESLRLLMTDIDSLGYREAYHAVIQLLIDKSRIQAGRIEELYRAAYGAGYAAVRYLLLSVPPKMVAKPDEVTPDHEILDIPLGRRKAMARLHDRDQLTRLCLDPHPQVVEILLDNPKLIERDVIGMAARRPTLGSVIEALGQHPRWSLRYEIQRAVALNPYSPTGVAVSLVPFHRTNHLLELAADARLHEVVRESARSIGSWRYERRGRVMDKVPEAEDRH